MSKRVYIFVIGMISFFGLAHAQNPKDYTCPERVAAIQKHDLSYYAMVIIKQTYKELGCETEFVSLPGKRGILSFNRLDVDGEVFRMTMAEKKYTTEFVRSSHPLFISKNYYWGHPNDKIRQSRPIGYSRGVVWHEEYMQDKKGIIFNNYESMFDAYNKGTIGGFLNSDIVVSLKIIDRGFVTSPVRQEEIITAPLYHYLSAEYADFMEAFSKYYNEHHPFTDFERFSN